MIPSQSQHASYSYLGELLVTTPWASTDKDLEAFFTGKKSCSATGTCGTSVALPVLTAAVMTSSSTLVIGGQKGHQNGN